MMVNDPPTIMIGGTLYVRIDPRRRPLAGLPDAVQAAIAGGASPLRGLRAGAGLTQADFAGAVGISRAMVAMVERGESGLSAERWVQAANVLAVSLDVLLPPV